MSTTPRLFTATRILVVAALSLAVPVVMAAPASAEGDCDGGRLGPVSGRVPVRQLNGWELPCPVDPCHLGIDGSKGYGGEFLQIVYTCNGLRRVWEFAGLNRKGIPGATP